MELASRQDWPAGQKENQMGMTFSEALECEKILKRLISGRIEVSATGGPDGDFESRRVQKIWYVSIKIGDYTASVDQLLSFPELKARAAEITKRLKKLNNGARRMREAQRSVEAE